MRKRIDTQMNHYAQQHSEPATDHSANLLSANQWGALPRLSFVFIITFYYFSYCTTDWAREEIHWSQSLIKAHHTFPLQDHVIILTWILTFTPPRQPCKLNDAPGLSRQWSNSSLWSSPSQYLCPVMCEAGRDQAYQQLNMLWAQVMLNRHTDVLQKIQSTERK